MKLWIRNGIVIDGSGKAPQSTDIVVEGDTIAALGERPEGVDQVIDAKGLIVAPGFIDIHSHTDVLLLAHPLAESKLLQGVTCEVGGNCGFSAAPMTSEIKAELSRELAQSQVEIDWEDTAGFFNRLEAQGIGPNFATLVGHGNLRGRIVGYEEREATFDEISAMREAAACALEQGVCGLSAGLIYPPGCYASTMEIIEVAKAVRKGGFFALHMRDEGAKMLEALEEALEIARGADLPLQISHHKVTGKANWGSIKKSIARIKAARADGLEVTADVYPYTATNTSLSAVLPDWIKSGGKAALLKRLKDPAMRQRLAQEWGERATEASHWEEYLVSRTFDMENRPLQGKRINELCVILKEPPLEVLVRLIVGDEGRTEMMRFAIAEEEIEALLKEPWVMLGSDAAAKDFSDVWGQPHPRGYGTFPRFLAEYVRRRNLLSLEEAIRKMTSLPAQKLNLTDRGRVGVGYKADLVIFDYTSLTDSASYKQPIQAPEGIARVLVNGVVAAKDGKLTGARPGKVLKPTKR